MAAASTKVYNSNSKASKARSCAKMFLILMLGATIFDIMFLQKMHERRIFNLYVNEKDSELLSLHQLVQNERDHNKEWTRKLSEMKETLYSLQTAKINVESQYIEMQSKVASLKDEQKTTASALEEKENKITLMRQKRESDSSVRASFRVTTLTEMLKHKESEIDDLRHQLENANVNSADTGYLVQDYKEGDIIQITELRKNITMEQELRQYVDDDDKNENAGIGVKEKINTINSNEEFHGENKLHEYTGNEKKIIEYEKEGVEDRNSMANPDQESQGGIMLRQYMDDENKIEQVVEESQGGIMLRQYMDDENKIEQVVVVDKNASTGIGVQEKSSITTSSEETPDETKLREYIDNEDKIEENISTKGKPNRNEKTHDETKLRMYTNDVKKIVEIVEGMHENAGTDKVSSIKKTTRNQERHSKFIRPAVERGNNESHEHPNKEFMIENSNRSSASVRKLIRDNDVVDFIHKLITGFFEDLRIHLSRSHNNKKRYKRFMRSSQAAYG